jgi:hypothetical protein
MCRASHDGGGGSGGDDIEENAVFVDGFELATTPCGHECSQTRSNSEAPARAPILNWADCNYTMEMIQTIDK